MFGTQSNITKNDSNIPKILESVGCIEAVKITDTLQGSIWRAFQTSSDQKIVIKVTDRFLHKNKMIVLNEQKIRVCENIKKETAILKRLSLDHQCPDSVVKYLGAFRSNLHYFLQMEDGGCSLFQFVVKAHKCIEAGILGITEWHKLAKVIFKQMIECIEYIHSKNICHFDISLENFLINDISVFHRGNTMRFVVSEVQVKLADFGLAEVFAKDAGFHCDKYCGKPTYQSPEISARKKIFSAKSNDVWCLGTCYFMLILGTCPWKRTDESDVRFNHIMNGNIVALLYHWNKINYVNESIMELFSSFFTFEDRRVSIDELKKSEWLLAP